MPWLNRFRRRPGGVVYDAALLPGSGEVVVTDGDMHEIVSAGKARAIATAVAQHDAAVAAGIIPARRAAAESVEP